MNTREATRQQLLLRAIVSRGDGLALQGWLHGSAGQLQRGLIAYQTNLGAAAERALAAALPTVRQLVGEESFATMARAYVREHPPSRGDLAWLGEGLPEFIAASESLREAPYLGDVARLEWALHRAEAAADTTAPPQGLERLADTEPDLLHMRFAPGVALVASRHPIVTIWQAHHSDAPDRFAPVREALAVGRGETALVWREGWRACVTALDAADAAFTQAAHQGRHLAAALGAAGPRFAFDAWIVRALRQGWIAGMDTNHSQES